jgi:Uncharacterized conserved protein (some members contain a von Willebrand factor type A (vWA) domain)
VKGDWTQYSFVVANEDYITFRNIKVNFLSDKSRIEAANRTIEYSLLPGEEERLETRIKCNYRGEYYVGVDSIEVTDFLYLFTIKYPLLSKLKAIVSPRVVKLERLAIAPPQTDVKNPVKFDNFSGEELDTEVRKYYPGDSKKRIHWRASAKMHELISRKYQHIPKAEIIIFMDLVKIQEDEMKEVMAEDKIIESALAISNYYASINTPSQIIYDQRGISIASITSREEFDVFYKICTSISFSSSIPISELMRERILRGADGMFCIVATHFLTKELYEASLQAITNGSSVSILYISDDTSQNSKNIQNGMKLSGISVYQVMSETEIGEVLSGGAA